MNGTELSDTHRCNLHIIAIALLSLVCRVTGVNSLSEYSDKVIADRVAEAPHLLPPYLETSGKYNLNIPQVMMDKVSIVSVTDFMFKKPMLEHELKIIFPQFQMALAECLQSAGIETGRLQSGLPYSLNSTDQNGPRHSWVDPSNMHAAAMSMGRGSTGDIQSFNDNDSVGSSPGVERRVLIPEFNFDAMKRVLGEQQNESSKRERSESQRQLTKTFRQANFDDLIRRTEPKHDVIQTRLSDLFNSLAVERQIMGQTDQTKSIHPNKLIYENNFPELFFY